MKRFLLHFLLACFLINCSSRDEDNNENVTATVLPKTLKSKHSLGDLISEYQYDRNKIKSVTISNGSKSQITYAGNFITKVVSYDSSGAVTSEFNYEYKNNRLSKTNYKIGLLTANIYYTWIDDNHVSFENDLYRPNNATDKTDLYFSNGNVVKSTNHTYYPNNYTIDKVDIIENDNRNNPFKNVEGYSLIAFDITADFFYQSNNILKITTTRTGIVNGEPLSENYHRNFQLSYTDKNYPQSYVVNSSYGYTTSYEFRYFEN